MNIDQYLPPIPSNQTINTFWLLLLGFAIGYVLTEAPKRKGKIEK